jgi:hypothetical protein
MTVALTNAPLPVCATLALHGGSLVTSELARSRTESGVWSRNERKSIYSFKGTSYILTTGLYNGMYSFASFILNGR